MAYSQHKGRRYTMAFVLFLAALIVRGYELSHQPLWFDELYSYQLARLGPAEIWRNSFVDPHPPLFYWLQWLVSGFGSTHQTWLWRIVAVLSGSATVPVVYLLANASTDAMSALAASLLLLVSPAHLYFSQEARPYVVVTCIAAITAWGLLSIECAPHRRFGWLWIAGFSILGLWTSYSYVFVAGVQILYLAFVLGQPRRTLLYFGVSPCAACHCLDWQAPVREQP